MALGVSFPVFAYKDLKRDIPIDFKILALDPGETVGYAFFVGASLIEHGELGPFLTVEGASFQVKELITRLDPHCVVMEGYRVYAWKARSHTHSNLFTARLIGAVQYITGERKIKRFEQSAHQAKSFVTDAKLKEWNFYMKGQKHARDAIRHAVFYLLFGKLPRVQKGLKLEMPQPTSGATND